MVKTDVSQIVVTGEQKRPELELNFFVIIVIALVLTIAIYIILFPFKSAFLGVLLYDRGITQPIVIFMSSIVVTFTLLKFFILRQELTSLRKKFIPENTNFDNYQSRQLINLWQNLAKEKSILANRCSRVIGAYINSGSRQAVTNLAVDDASFYISASESSYALPRILIWAIPLLGFIGTLIGISDAVSGFSSFLEQSAEIEQIKQGITTITSGLSIAFDTTLLALSLSVLVMIPLVLIERLESRLLLNIDIYINDKLLSRLTDSASNFNEEKIKDTIQETLEKNLPKPEDLITPAQEYAQQAASQLATGFIQEISKVQQISDRIIEQISEINQNALEDREKFISVFEKQQETNQAIVREINYLVNEIKTRNLEIAEGFSIQSQEIKQQLEQTAQLLATRLVSLEATTAKLGEITLLQNSLEQIGNSLEKTAQLEQVLQEIQQKMLEIKPTLEQISKPRRLTLVENLE